MYHLSEYAQNRKLFAYRLFLLRTWYAQVWNFYAYRAKNRAYIRSTHRYLFRCIYIQLIDFLRLLKCQFLTQRIAKQNMTRTLILHPYKNRYCHDKPEMLVSYCFISGIIQEKLQEGIIIKTNRFAKFINRRNNMEPSKQKTMIGTYLLIFKNVI